MTRTVTRWMVSAAAILSMFVVPFTAGVVPAGADDEVRGGGGEMVQQARRMDDMFVQLFNERRFEELGTAYYVENAIVVAPNHEPIQGRAAIVEYFRGARDGFGDIAVLDPWRASTSGDLVSIVGNYTGQSGRLRATSHELFERQPDGSLKCTVDMFGFRDPLR